MLKPRMSVLKGFIMMAEPTVRRAPLCPKGLYCASAKRGFTINCENWKEKKRKKPASQTSNKSCSPFFFRSVERNMMSYDVW